MERQEASQGTGHFRLYDTQMLPGACTEARSISMTRKCYHWSWTVKQLE